MGRTDRAVFAAACIVFVALQWSPSSPATGVGVGFPGMDKALHAALYAAMALLTWRLLPPAAPATRAGVVVAAGFLVGLVMEAGQAGIEGRMEDPADALADLGGLLMAGLWLTWRPGGRR